MRSWLLLWVFLVSGCATPEQQALDQWHRQQAYSARLDQQCLNYGFKYDTPDFARCKQQTHEANRAAAMGILMNQQRPAPQVQPYQVPIPTRTDCVRTYGGNYTCTTR